MTENTSRESYLADGWMYGRTGKLNWHLLTQRLDQKVDTIASHTVREGILETHTRLMLGIDVHPSTR